MVGFFLFVEIVIYCCEDLGNFAYSGVREIEYRRFDRALVRVFLMFDILLSFWDDWLDNSIDTLLA